MGNDRVVIVGSGLGGLTAATILARRGVETVVIEKRSTVGGYNSAHRERGYRWDIGATMLQTPRVLREAFAEFGEELDRHLQLERLDPHYRTWFSDGEHLNFMGSVDATAQEIARFSEADAQGFRRYIADMEGHKRTLKSLLIDRAVTPQALMQPRALDLLRTFNPARSVQDLAGRYFQTPHIRTAMTFQTLYWGTSPSRCPAPYAMVPFFETAQGVWYVRGGINAISEAIASIYTGLGGVIRCGDPVDRVTVKHGRVHGVVLAGGETLAADRVISNADALYTYRDLIAPSALPAWFRARLRRVSPSLAAQVSLIGLRAPDALPNLPHHTFTMPVDLEDLTREMAGGGIDPAARSAYICVPTKTDTSVAPPGRTAIYALALAPRGTSEVTRRDSRRRAVDGVLGELERRGVLTGGITVDYEHVFQPEDFAADFNQPHGMGFGIQPTLRQIGPLRFGNRSSMVDGLYLAGASANPGGGIPLVVASGRAAARAVLHDRDRRR